MLVYFNIVIICMRIYSTIPTMWFLLIRFTPMLHIQRSHTTSETIIPFDNHKSLKIKYSKWVILSATNLTITIY